MAGRALSRLTATQVRNAKPGSYNTKIADGGGLWLQISKNGAKSWIFIFRWKDKPTDAKSKLKEIGLGSLLTVSLAKAREEADKCRRWLAEGKNPAIERKIVVAAIVESTAPTLKEFAFDMIEEWAKGFKTTPPKPGEGDAEPWHTGNQRTNWRYTFSEHCKEICDLPVDRIGIAEVAKVVAPLWGVKHETAHKLRRRLEKVLAAAKMAGYRSGENPARLKDNLDLLLPQSRTKVTHQPALPFEEVPDFLRALRAKPGMGAEALEVVLFTLVRTHELLYSEKSDADQDALVWTIPEHRMKGKVGDRAEHTIPLVPQAARILHKYGSRSTGNCRYIFGAMKREKPRSDVWVWKPMSNQAMDRVLDRMGMAHVTVHGFRSSFRDWVSEKTDFDGELAELSLAHIVGDKTTQAYRRRTSLDKRRVLLQAWADYIDPKPPSTPPAP